MKTKFIFRFICSNRKTTVCANRICLLFLFIVFLSPSPSPSFASYLSFVAHFMQCSRSEMGPITINIPKFNSKQRNKNKSRLTDAVNLEKCRLQGSELNNKKKKNRNRNRKEKCIISLKIERVEKFRCCCRMLKLNDDITAHE